MSTELLHLTDGTGLEAHARVDQVRADDGRAVLLLNRTVFCPQGGGQACDQGVIEGDSFQVAVDSVRLVDGEVLHSGVVLQGSPAIATAARLRVDPKRRAFNSKLQTGGHILVNAMRAVGLNLAPVKGYHFPDHPHVDFETPGTRDVVERLMEPLQAAVDDLTARDVPVVIELLTRERLSERSIVAPAGVPEAAAVRVVTIDGLPQACSGTHVQSLGSLRGMRVTETKIRKGVLRVAYEVPE